MLRARWLVLLGALACGMGLSGCTGACLNPQPEPPGSGCSESSPASTKGTGGDFSSGAGGSSSATGSGASGSEGTGTGGNANPAGAGGSGPGGQPGRGIGRRWWCSVDERCWAQRGRCGWRYESDGGDAGPPDASHGDALSPDGAD